MVSCMWWFEGFGYDTAAARCGRTLASRVLANNRRHCRPLEVEDVFSCALLLEKDLELSTSSSFGARSLGPGVSLFGKPSFVWPVTG
jgi:hypothetical protein